MTIDPLWLFGLLIAMMGVLCIWAGYMGYIESKREEEEQADDGVKHTKEYYDRNRNR